MPVSEKSARRTHRAGARGRRAQQQCRGQRPVRRREDRSRLARTCEPGARRAAYAARARRSDGRRGRCRHVAQDGRSRDRRTRRLSPRDSQRGEQDARRPALDAGRLHPRFQPVVRRGLGPQRRAAGDPRELRRRRAGSAVGRQRLSAAAVGAPAPRRRARRPFRPAALARHRHEHFRAHFAGLRACAQPADPARGARARRGSARRSCYPTAWRCSMPPFRARTRPRGRHLGSVGRGDGRGRAADRRLARRHASAGRRSSTSTCRSRSARSCSRCASSPKAARPARAAPIMPERCSRRRAWRPHLCPDPVVGDAPRSTGRR